MSGHPVGTVLVSKGDRLGIGHPDACRIVKRATTGGDWPWTRLTGLPTDLPTRDSDLAGWVVQPLWQVARVLGHKE